MFTKQLSYVNNPPETSRQTKASGKKRAGRDSKKLSGSKSKLKRVSTSKKKSATVAERPKRAVIPKNLDGATGLSWQEENELKRALYASLQECRRLSRQSSPELAEVSPPGPPDKQSGKKLSKKKVQPTTRLPRKDKALPKNLLSKPTTNEIKTKSTSTENQSFERLKQETKSLFKAKMHAQRKFAQNTVPFTSSPSITPVKMRASPSEKKEILHGKKAKTEDFLTFLCLRGTDVLPPRLDFFSYADTVTPSPSKSGGSRSSTPLSKVGLWKKGSAPRNTANSDSNLGVKPLPKDSPAKVRKDKKQKKMVSSLKGEPKASRGRRLPPPLIPAIPLKSQNETDRTKDKIKHLRAKQLTKKAKTIKTSSLSSSVNKSRSRLKRKLDTEQEFDSTPQLPEKKGKIDRKLSEKTKRKNLKNVSKYSLHENGSDHSEVNLAEVQDPTDDGIQSDAEQVAARPRLRSKLKRLESEDSEISFKNQVGDGERTAIEDEKQEILELDETRGKPKGKPTKKKRAVERNSLAVAKKTKLCAEIEPPAKKPARSKVKNSDPTSSATCGLGGENVQSSCIPLPTFHPSIDEFHDPLVYIEGICEQAEQFGMCKIVPPSGWKPECRIQEEMRFTSQLQYVHKMQDRWGPSVLELECIRRHLQSQGIKLDHPPVVAGIELDLAKCNKIIQEFGGMQKVIDKKKWVKVADALGLPVVAHDRSAKLYSAYCKYLLSYATLPAEEVAKIREQVISEHAKKKDFSDDNCVAKGRSMTPANFFRAAEMTQAAWMKDQITPEKVEEEYWKYVNNKDCHVTVQCGHVDTNACGSAFPSKGTHSKHGWNYNVLSQHKNCVLRHLGPVMGVSSPTLHLGMLFSTSCWSTDPHRLPYIQYLHTGAPVIWYCIPREEVSKFKSAMFEMVPNILSKNQVWLPEDTAMVSPSLLASKGVTVGRTLQKEGEFMVVFSEAFTGTVSCGYNINESLHIATAEWLPLGNEAANMLHASCEPELFSMDKLLWRLAKNETTPVDTLKIVFPLLEQSIKRELNQRLQLIAAGLKQFEQMKVEDEGHLPNTRRKRSSLSPDQDEHVCDVNKKICFFSMVVSEANERETFYSLESALVHISKKQLKTCKLMYRYDEKELHKILDNVKVRLTATDSPRKRNKIK